MPANPMHRIVAPTMTDEAHGAEGFDLRTTVEGINRESCQLALRDLDAAYAYLKVNQSESWPEENK